jgi:hypothetical protein
MAYQVTMDCHVQNDYQLYLALTNSVDEDTNGKMQREKSEFMTGVAGDVPSSLLYYKKLMMKAKIDSQTMASHIRDNLGSLNISKQQSTATFPNSMILYAIKWQPSVPVEKPLMTFSTTCLKHMQGPSVRNSMTL